MFALNCKDVADYWDRSTITSVKGRPRGWNSKLI